jgi:hypothetical protein
MTKSINISGLLVKAPEAQRFIAAGGESLYSTHAQQQPQQGAATGAVETGCRAYSYQHK